MLRNNRLYIGGLLLFALILFLVASSGVSAAVPLRDWQYVKTITFPAGLQQEGLVEFFPDRELFAGSLSGLADVRIIMDEDTEVPYKLEVSKAKRQHTSFQVTFHDKGYVPGLYTTFIADMGRAGILHNEIEFQTPSTNFRRTATVETSNDERIWMEVAEQTVYDFTVKERNFTTRNTRVRYPDSTARYLRVRITDEDESPVEINSATVFFVEETPAQEVSWPVSILGTSYDTTQRTTVVDVDLGTPGIPSYRLAIKIPEDNFHRDVTVQSSGDREAWRTILSRSNIYAYDTPKFTGSNTVISYPETTARYLRLIIYDEDSPSLTIQSVDVWGPQYRLVFSANPQHSYQLYYGNTEARRPSYDIEQIFPYLVTSELPEAELGPQAANPDFVEKKPPVSERFPWLFPTVIVVAAVLVALLLLGIVRQARKVLPPPPQ